MFSFLSLIYLSLFLCSFFIHLPCFFVDFDNANQNSRFGIKLCHVIVIINVTRHDELM